MNYSIAQDALTLAATAILYTAIVYIAGGILHQIWKTPSPQPVESAPTPKTPTVGEAPKTPDPAPTPIPAPIQSAALTIAPSALRVEESPKSGTIRELRKLCTQAGVKGAARFTKAQCLAALG